MFMINKVLENLIGTSIEHKFEEIKVEEVRARRQAEIDAEMKNKGKIAEDVEDDDDEEDVEEDDDEEDDDEDKVDDADDVFSASSHSDSDDDDDDGQGGTSIKVTEALNEGNGDDYLRDDANEETEDAKGGGRTLMIKMLKVKD
ncbi:hypothetical protein HanPI659440_Chr01g0016231 [Helianthus annuus]|nr:hypothetical protein HanPI659440_Chr01g0016231 [Helianthus annuus]